MALIAANQPRNPVEAFPNFLTFSVDPEEGPNLHTWNIKPYHEWFNDEAKNVETFAIVAKNTSTGIFVGGATLYASDRIIDYFGNIVPKLKKIKDTITGTVGSAVAIGSAIGGVVGMVRGIILTQRFYLERPLIINTTHESSTRAKKIISAFVESQVESIQNIDEITCQISSEIMVFPVSIDCGSQPSHTFEYYSILRWLGENRKGAGGIPIPLEEGPKGCPICRRPAEIKNLTYNSKTEKKVHEAVADIFKKMEAILERLPKRFLGMDTLPNFSESDNIAYLAKKIEKGKKFLDGDIEVITEKVKKPETLSLEETFALGYFLIHQFKPLKGKIDQIYLLAGDYLRKLNTQGRIEKSDYDIQLKQLENWYATFDVIPGECKIIRKLYNI